jgi:hypothetical protein
LEEKLGKFKRSTDQDLNTLKYFHEHPQEKGNLFALFTQIDEKICFNTNIIKSAHFQITLPYPSSSSMQEDVNSKKLLVYEGFISQLMPILKGEIFRKYCKKEA